MKQVIKNSPANRREKANFVMIKKVKLKTLPNGAPLVMAQTSSKVTSTGKGKPGGSINTYVTSVEVRGKYVILSCSCPDFMFTWEFALNKQKAARIEYCNGEHPAERNPTLLAGTCCHSIRLGERMMDEGQI